MRAKGVWIGGLLLVLLLLFCAACFIPVRIPHHTYRSVNDDDTWPFRLVSNSDEGVKIGADFAIFDGELYLLIQTKYRSLLLVMHVKSKEWDPREVTSFRRSHSELDSLWPDITQPDGGVKWIAE